MLSRLTFTALLSASAIALPARAQVAYPPATVYGAGSSLIAPTWRRALDCEGAKIDLAFRNLQGAGQLRSIFDFNYIQGAARYDCAVRTIQPSLSFPYLSTGSEVGRRSWLAGNIGSLQDNNPLPRFPSLQYAITETPLTSSDLTSYFSVATAPNFTTTAQRNGSPIQIPLLIAPISVAYDPVYAKVRNASGAIDEYRFTVANARSDGSGGLRLTQAQYCGIFNGTITNWNQLPANVVNKDVNDPASFNVPIRLVGQADLSGTTAIFTRALAAQCDGRSVNTGIGGTAPATPIVNKFVNAENRLPYDGVTQIPGTAYVGAAGFVSPTNSLSGALFEVSTQTIQQGTEAPGLFSVARENNGVAGLLNLHPDPSGTIGDRTINGRIGYIATEYTLPKVLFTGVNNFGLHNASLRELGANIYNAPYVYAGLNALKTIQPPQSKGTAGGYCSDRAACPAAYGDRANPRDWVQISDKSAPIAMPTTGYPIVGTVNMLLYTCYADDSVRQALVHMLSLTQGKISKDSVNANVPAGLLTYIPNSGAFTASGYGILPTAWRNAITETFLKRSLQTGRVGDVTSRLGNLNIWIQDRLPTIGDPTSAANPQCTEGVGG